MKKRFIAALMLVFLVASAAFSAQPEDALTAKPDESVYLVLKLDDTSALLKWFVSDANINAFMPLILSSEDSNDIIGTIEMVNQIIQKTPMKSAALLVGATGKSVETINPFLQMAFTVGSELTPIVKNLENGQANAKDIAKLLLGTDSPLISFAETMIKVERGNDNIFTIDNAVFLKAVDDLIILGLSEDDVKASVKALEDKKARLSAVNSRRFKTKDFALIHFDPKTLDAFNDDSNDIDVKVSDYFVNPVTTEFGFLKSADRFVLSSHANVKESMIKYAASKLNMKPVKGGYIDLKNSGGASVPMFAMGGRFDLPSAVEINEAKEYLDPLFEQLKKRFGVDKSDVLALFDGAFSMVVNGSVKFESFMIPAIYISQTGAKGAASKIYTELVHSKPFHEIRDGILQVDSSLSPVSCIIGHSGNTLGIAFAELASFQDRPAQTGAFGDHMNKEGISSFWIDFAGIQSWLKDDSNGIFAAITPMASIFGYGQILNAVQDVLSAEFSVTSMSFMAEDVETYHMEFALKDINPANGLLTKIIKIYRDFK